MRRERRQPTRAEIGRITSPGLVIRKVRPPKRKSQNAAEESKRKEGEG